MLAFQAAAVAALPIYDDLDAYTGTDDKKDSRRDRDRDGRRRDRDRDDRRDRDRDRQRRKEKGSSYFDRRGDEGEEKERDHEGGLTSQDKEL